MEDLNEHIQRLKEEREKIGVRIAELQKTPEQLGHRMDRYIRVCSLCDCREGTILSGCPCPKSINPPG